MMKKEYLTIKEVADRVGVSYQAVYKRLNSTLKDYVEEVDGRKVLRSEVLNEYFSTKKSTVKSTLNSTVEGDFKPSSSDEEEIKRINKRNEDIIDDLRAQLKDKDEQIKRQSEHIVELSGRITELFENNQKLQLNYQLLLSDPDRNKDIVDVDIDGARAEEEIINEVDLNEEETIKEDKEDEEVIEDIEEETEGARVDPEDQPKKSFFRRLFNI